jgi:hypothetical protein
MLVGFKGSYSLHLILRYERSEQLLLYINSNRTCELKELVVKYLIILVSVIGSGAMAYADSASLSQLREAKPNYHCSAFGLPGTLSPPIVGTGFLYNYEINEENARRAVYRTDAIVRKQLAEEAPSLLRFIDEHRYDIQCRSI